MTRSLAPLLCAALIVSACAKQPDAISAAYVSPTVYAERSCAQLVAERDRVVHEVNVLTQKQSEKATNDAVATGVGLVLFWPALFFIGMGADQEAQLAALKGNYDALSEAGRSRGCFG